MTCRTPMAASPQFAPTESVYVLLCTPRRSLADIQQSNQAFSIGRGGVGNIRLPLRDAQSVTATEAEYQARLVRERTKATIFVSTPPLSRPTRSTPLPPEIALLGPRWRREHPSKKPLTSLTKSESNNHILKDVSTVGEQPVTKLFEHLVCSLCFFVRTHRRVYCASFSIHTVLTRYSAHLFCMSFRCTSTSSPLPPI